MKDYLALVSNNEHFWELLKTIENYRELSNTMINYDVLSNTNIYLILLYFLYSLVWFFHMLIEINFVKEISKVGHCVVLRNETPMVTKYIVVSKRAGRISCAESQTVAELA